MNDPGGPGPGSPPERSSEAAIRTVREIVPAALAEERIDRVVSFMADVSRREAADLIAGGKVLVNGTPPSKVSVRVAVDDEVQVEVEVRVGGLTPDANIAFDVVYVDDEIVIVDKPADLVVHPGSGTPDGTLVHGLLARFPDIADVGESDRPGIVHRLDRGTTGLLMVARTDRAYRSLVGQLADRTVVRRYRTAVEGVVENDEGLIDAPLGRSPRQATRRAVVVDGNPARTRYRVVERHPDSDVTVLTCRLETGRTHQIRAHLEAIGHPVVGDVTYGASPNPDLGRPFLHAELLGFTHPGTGSHVEFSSELPADLQHLLQRWSRE
jgi:23S rRNA pseudouridine1911/1915/1917 synthase